MALNASGHVVIIDVRVGRGVAKADASLKQVAQRTRQAGQQAKQTTRDFHGLAGAFTALFAAGMVKRGLDALVKPAIEYEQVLTRLRVLTGANAKEMGEYETKIKAVASISPYGPTEVAQALQELRRATGSTTVALDALKPTAQLAMASMGKMGLEGATKMVTQTIKAFGLEAKQVPDAMERLAAVSLATGVGIENFANVMSRMSTANLRGGQSLDEIAMSFALAGRNVVEPERNIRLLSTAISMLQQKKPMEVLGQLGVRTTDEATGGMRRLRDIWVDLYHEYERNAPRVQSALAAAFGMRGGESVAGILGQLSTGIEDSNKVLRKGAEAFDYLEEQMRSSGGLLDKFANEWLGTTGAQLEIFIENVGILGKTIGKGIMPVLKSLAEILKPIAQAFSWLADTGIGALTSKLLAVKLALWGLRAGFFGVINIVKNVATNLLGISAAATRGVFPVKAFFGAIRAEATATVPVLSRVRGLMGVMGRGASLAGKAAAGGLLGRLLGGLGGGAMTLGLVFLPEIWEDLKNIKKYWNESFGSQADKWKQFYKDLADKGTKATELASRRMKEFTEQVLVGSQAMDTLLGSFKSFASYEPPNLRKRSFLALESKLQGLAGGGGEKARDAQYLLQTSVKTIRSLMPKWTSGSITGREQSQLLHAMRMMYSGSWSMLGSGGISRDLIKRFGKEFYGEAAKVSDPMNRVLAGDIAQMKGMRLATNDERIPGTSPAAAAFGEPGLGPSPEMERNFPLHSKFYQPGTHRVRSWGSVGLAGGGSRTDPLLQMAVEVTADAAKQQHEKRLKTLEEIRDLLARRIAGGGGLGASKDPLGGEGGGWWGGPGDLGRF